MQRMGQQFQNDRVALTIGSPLLSSTNASSAQPDRFTSRRSKSTFIAIPLLGDIIQPVAGSVCSPVLTGHREIRPADTWVDAKRRRHRFDNPASNSWL
jgi:hypothetical protein